MNVLRKCMWAMAFMALCPYLSEAQTVTFTVYNDSWQQRQEVVEVSYHDICTKLGLNDDSGTIVVRNALGQEVMWQKTYDGKLLVDASVRPCGEASFTATVGVPNKMKIFVTGKQYPERVDDIAWENDRTAYRLYGPALQRSGERAFGIDVWVKNTPDLQVEERYNTELSNHERIQQLLKEGKNDEAKEMEIKTTYHFDHGYGLDCYKVGPSLGCGAPALMVDGSLILPYCYKDFKILDNGPLRFTVELTYHPTAIGTDKSVTEHRIISLDKGSNFNKMSVWYEGLSKPCDLAAGVVIHQEDTQSVLLGRDYLGYADPTDNPSAQNFQIYVGILFPNMVNETKVLPLNTAENGIYGHAVGVYRQLKNNERYTYYFGSAWSKNDVKNLNEWKARMETQLDALHSPLEVNIK